MAVTVSKSQTREWSPKSQLELPADQRLVLTLRPISFGLRTYLSGLASSTEDGAARMAPLLMRASVAGFRGLKQEGGAEVPFGATTLRIGGHEVKGAPDDATFDALNALDNDSLGELLSECMQSMGLTKSDVLS